MEFKNPCEPELTTNTSDIKLGVDNNDPDLCSKHPVLANMMSGSLVFQ
jgi:hypothetical protein